MIETPRIVETEERQYACTRRTVPVDQIGVVMMAAIGVVVAAMQAQGMAPVGPWFTHHFRRPVDFFDFEVCFPLASAIEATGEGDEAVRPGVWPAMRVAQTVHHGEYGQLPHAWGELEAWIKTKGLTGGGEFWEVYAVDPQRDPNPANWRTELNWPLVG